MKFRVSFRFLCGNCQNTNVDILNFLVKLKSDREQTLYSHASRGYVQIFEKVVISGVAKITQHSKETSFESYGNQKI